MDVNNNEKQLEDSYRKIAGILEKAGAIEGDVAGFIVVYMLTMKKENPQIFDMLTLMIDSIKS